MDSQQYDGLIHNLQNIKVGIAQIGTLLAINLFVFFANKIFKNENLNGTVMLINFVYIFISSYKMLFYNV